MSLCASCKCSILWFKTASGKNIPVDYTAGAAANLQLNMVFDRKRHTAHFETCPHYEQKERRSTCLGCESLVYYKMPGGMMAGCDKRFGALVPQNFKPGRITFWRIPLECPLPSDQVQKSLEKIDPEKWEVIETDTIENALDPLEGLNLS